MASPQNNRIGSNPGRSQHGAKGAGKADDATLDEFDLADELKGDNALKGEDQLASPSQRQAQAGATGETDSLMESFKKTDKHYRAESEANARGSQPGTAERKPRH